MIDKFTPAHEPNSVMCMDDDGVRQATEDLRCGIERMRRELAYRRVWQEYRDTRRELDALRKEQGS